MGIENLKCFRCQNYGHLAKDCPEETYAAELGDGKPPWCCQCDRETRLIYFLRDGYLTARKCYTCHPNSQTLPAQFSKCRNCKTVVYAWDIRSECGKHQPIGHHAQPIGATK